MNTFYEKGFGGKKNLPVVNSEQITEIITQSHQYKLPVLMHANSYKAHQFAVTAGVDIIAHGMWNWHGIKIGNELPHPIRKTLDQMISKNIGYMPTMRVLAGIQALYDPEFLNDPQLRHVLPVSLIDWYQSEDGKWFAETIKKEEGMEALDDSKILLKLRKMGMNVLIIEDELLAQKELTRLLLKCEPTIHFSGYLESIEESVAWISENNDADLIFMDIELSDGLSFEIFNKIAISTPVIFTTAYDAYAIKAFKVNSIDYLLKPIEQKDLQASLEKYQNLKKQFSKTANTLSEAQIKQLLGLHKKEYKTRFISSVGDHIRHIDITEIAYFYADDKIVFAVTPDKKEYIIDYTLETLETLLNPQHFFRLNRTYLAHITAIKAISKYFKGRLIVSLLPKAPKEIVISRERSLQFKKWLDH